MAMVTVMAMATETETAMATETETVTAMWVVMVMETAMAMVVETVAAMETAMVAATAAAVPQAKPDLSVPPPCMRRVARLLPQDAVAPIPPMLLKPFTPSPSPRPRPRLRNTAKLAPRNLHNRLPSGTLQHRPHPRTHHQVPTPQNSPHHPALRPPQSVPPAHPLPPCRSAWPAQWLLSSQFVDPPDRHSRFRHR